MAVKFVVAHRVDVNNVGDMASNPLQYFLKEDEYVTIDINNISQTKYPSDVPVIVGGGGLIGNDFLNDNIRNVFSSSDKNQLINLWKHRWYLSNSLNKDIHDQFIEDYKSLISDTIKKINQDTAPRFLWGAGHNGDFIKKIKGPLEYPDWFAEFQMIGIRDYNQSLPWVPCASCMHPALRKNYTIKNEVIWFEHKKQMVRDFGTESIPRFINSGSNIEQTIELLGTANIILTNSYHGAYWGSLMGKKVIVVGAWSSKFQFMKYSPLFLEKEVNWLEHIDEINVPPADYLEECITANETFWEKIKSSV